MRLLWWLPISVLALGLAGIGFRYGILRQGMSEGAVIAAYAERYLADHRAAELPGQARLSDCSARPSDGLWVWVVVRCQAPGAGVEFVYEVNWLGGLNRHSGPQPLAPARPKA
ncbi:hypothetical protein [Arenibacterium sp. LLYu02]|uniref:hypothetical protein n=1 Tax=Arenibacterium sp. LLYu02 TaxID=3404132 RepID=UPI003B21AE5F